MEAQKALHAVERKARLLKVSLPGFYARLLYRREHSKAVARWSGGYLDEEVRNAHTASHGTNGAPRVVREPAHQGIRVDRKTVATSMRRQGLEEISPRRVRPAAPIREVVRMPSRIWSDGAGIPESWMRCGSRTSRTCPRTRVTVSVCRP